MALLPSAWGQPKGSRSSGWDLPTPQAGDSPISSWRGEQSQPSPEASGASLDVSPQPMSLYPATPRFAPAVLWRAKLLSCCRTGVWPPDGDLHPQQLLSITRLSLQKCLLPSPQLLQLYLQIFSFCIPAQGCPRHLSCDAKCQTHGRGSCPMGLREDRCVPRGLCQVPLLPGDRACMSLGELAAMPCMQN